MANLRVEVVCYPEMAGSFKGVMVDWQLVPPSIDLTEGRYNPLAAAVLVMADDGSVRVVEVEQVRRTGAFTGGKTE